MFHVRPTRELFKALVDKTNAKLSTWKANSLSKAGRMVLTHSNFI